MFIVHNLSSVYERSDFSVSSETRYRQNSDDFQQGENSIIFQSIHLHLVSNTQSASVCPWAKDLLILKIFKPPSKFNLKINKENLSVCADAT